MSAPTAAVGAEVATAARPGGIKGGGTEGGGGIAVEARDCGRVLRALGGTAALSPLAIPPEGAAVSTPAAALEAAAAATARPGGGKGGGGMIPNSFLVPFSLGSLW